MDNSASSQTAANAGAVAMVGLIIVFELIFVGAIIAVFIWMYWRIFNRVGMSGPLALLNLIPGIGNIICLVVLAFGAWPIEQELQTLRAKNLPTTTLQ